MTEIQLAKVASKSQFLHFMQQLEGSGAIIINAEDYIQLDIPADQMYIDYKINDDVVTLHYEHYTGIFLQSETVDMNQLIQLISAG